MYNTHQIQIYIQHFLEIHEIKVIQFLVHNKHQIKSNASYIYFKIPKILSRNIKYSISRLMHPTFLRKKKENPMEKKINIFPWNNTHQIQVKIHPTFLTICRNF